MAQERGLESDLVCASLPSDIAETIKRTGCVY